MNDANETWMSDALKSDRGESRFGGNVWFGRVASALGFGDAISIEELEWMSGGYV